MTARTVDVNFKFHSVADFEDYTASIKDAVVRHMSYTERFSAIRLRNTSLKYNDWLHKKRGVTTGRDTIEVVETHGALDLAGTIIHELAHAMVGVTAHHNSDWSDACKALGLLKPEASLATEDCFTPDMLAAILEAIERFAKSHPTLVYDDNFIPKPASQTDDYLPFQLDGIRWMLRNPNNILLGDEMGLGKTVEVMGYINVAHPKNILVVCPNNAKLVWKRHFEQWCIHPYDIELVTTSLCMGLGDVLIANYEAIVKWDASLRSIEWDLVVYDEGHYLKNPSAKRSKACYSIKGKKSIIITGTPIVNYPYEIFPLIHYLDRERWPEYGRFEATYGSRGSNRFGHNLNRLNSLLRSTIMLRRLKRDVLAELPKKRRQVIEFEVDDETRVLIEEEKRLWEMVQADANAEQVKMFNAMVSESATALDDIDWQAIVMQLTSTKSYAFTEMSRIAHKIARAKLPLVYEHIETALESKEKVIVFGHHRDVLEAVANRFKPHAVLLLGGHGASQPEVIQQASDRFNNDDNCRLFVGGISIAQSYSLRASSTVVFIEESWIPGEFSQAEDRAHGIGRGEADAKSLSIYHLVFEDSLDTRKAQLNIRKQRSIDKAMNR